MELLDELRKIADCENFVESKNYYYDYHLCKLTGYKEKINLNFTLSNDMTDEILRFGSCKNCGLCIYHKDFQNNSF
ncbi:MAG: hypothetical protein ACI4VF_08815 [Lachnospirales bacterium]